MTLLEKAMQEHPGLDEDRIISFLCPCDLGYESMPDGCEQVGAVHEVCRVCWNREAGDTSSAAAAADKLGMSRRASESSPQGEGKEEGDGEDGV